MLNLAVAGGVALAALIGGVAVTSVSVGSQADTAAVADTEPPEQVPPRAETAKSGIVVQLPLVRQVRLGVGERLETSLVKEVRSMDGTLSDGQVQTVVQTLLDGIRAEAAGVDLNTLSPGAAVSVMRQVGDHGVVVWSFYLGKNSGITQPQQ